MRNDLLRQADQLWPLIERKVRALVLASGGAAAGVASVGEHDIGGALHKGVLRNDQAPQFLLLDGTRGLSGNLAVDTGVTIDGIDISAHAADPNAHHAMATAGTGISVIGQQVGLAAGANYQFIGTGGGTAAGWRNVSELAGNGLTAATGALAVGVANTGAPGLSVEVDAVRLTSNSNPGAAAAVLASDASGYLNLVRLVLTDRLRASLIDTASGDMSITPAGDLTLNPGGAEIFIPGADTIRSSTWTAGLLGVGWGIQERAAGKSHLDIRSIYTDELIATTFTADQVRLRMGSDWLSESLAIAARDNSDAKVTIPNVGGGTVRIYVENAPEVAGQIFDANEHVLIKTINRSSGLVIRETWGQVSSYQTETGNRQSYLWTTTIGGGNFTLEPGTALVGFGVSGGSYIYRTVIEAGRGPYERFATWSTNPYTPANRVSRVEVGDIKNAAGDSTTRYGIAAGNNVGLTPATGFSGFTSDSVYGMRMYNTLLHLYDSSYLKVKLESALGLLLLAGTGGIPSTAGNAIRWTPDLTAGSPSVVGEMYNDSAGSTRTMVLRGKRGAQSFGQLLLAASNNSGDQAYITLQANSDGTGSLYSQVEGSYSWNVSSTGGFNFSRSGGTLPTMKVNGLYDIYHTGNMPSLDLVAVSLRTSGGGNALWLDSRDGNAQFGIYNTGNYLRFWTSAGDRMSIGTNGDVSTVGSLYAANVVLNYSGLYSSNVIQLLNQTNAAPQAVFTAALLASNSYAAHGSRVPSNGIYSYGGLLVGDKVSIGAGYIFDVQGEGHISGAMRSDSAFSLAPVSTPATSGTYYVIFIDSADGKLKYKTTGGTVRTLSYT